MKLYYWSLDTYYNADELTVENADGWAEMTGKNGFYKAAVEGIYAKNIDQTIFVAGVYESDGETYSTGVLAYSLGTYCTDRAEKGNEPMPALAKATAAYGYYAKQYFGG